MTKRVPSIENHRLDTEQSLRAARSANASSKHPPLPNQVTLTRRVSLKWGGQDYSLAQADEGFSRISGTTGAGKTHVLKFHVLDILREIETNPYAKLILFEPKREFYSWLKSLGLKSKIHYFHPSDKRSVPLDLEADYDSVTDAMTLAYSFYPELPHASESSFWGDSYRTIFASVYLAVKQKFGRVDMRLVLLVLEDKKLLKKVLSFNPYLRQARLLAGLTGKSETDTQKNIEYTFAARIFKMKSMAAHLDVAAREMEARGQGERPFSLRRFIKEENSGIFLISRDDTYKHGQDAMNGVLFERFTQLLDGEQKDKRRRIFVIIDEFPTLCGDARCPGVRTMFLRLRSRGAIPLIADQGDSSLKPIYEDDTGPILGMCTNHVFLRQPDDDSAIAAAKVLGEERGSEVFNTVSFGGRGMSVSENVHHYDRTIITPSALKKLPLSSKGNGVEGWTITALDKAAEPRKLHIPPQEVDALPQSNEELFQEYDKRPDADEILRDLTPDELHVLHADDVRALSDESLERLLGN